MKKRKQEKYSVSKCKGKRYAVSSIPSMQKMLNKDYEKQRMAWRVFGHQQTLILWIYCWDNKPLFSLLSTISTQHSLNNYTLFLLMRSSSGTPFQYEAGCVHNVVYDIIRRQANEESKIPSHRD